MQIPAQRSAHFSAASHSRLARLEARWEGRATWRCKFISSPRKWATFIAPLIWRACGSSAASLLSRSSSQMAPRRRAGGQRASARPHEPGNVSEKVVCRCGSLAQVARFSAHFSASFSARLWPPLSRARPAWRPQSGARSLGELGAGTGR